MSRLGIIITAFGLALIGLIIYSSLGGTSYRVNVCMTYGGNSACKTVSAKSEQGALQAAVTGACADISSGVTDTVKCQQSEPKSLKWLRRPQ